jgi:SAM-dependent methyltransferase
MNDPRLFARVDDEPDSLFYREPRLVEHIDPPAIAAIETIYRERIPANADVLDLMSSWVSHLPPEARYASVTGLGMNAYELERNPRLDRYDVADLNARPSLPYADASFDAALICVSIQYLTSPVAVMRELARVVRPDGTAIVTFSNRCFPTKAVAVWRATDDRSHLAIVRAYFEEAGNWDRIEAIERAGRFGDPLYAVIARRVPVDAGPNRD